MRDEAMSNTMNEATGTSVKAEIVDGKLKIIDPVKEAKRRILQSEKLIVMLERRIAISKTLRKKARLSRELARREEFVRSLKNAPKPDESALPRIIAKNGVTTA
jgi:hypothetical protein